jgi:hypothetical protein
VCKLSLLRLSVRCEGGNKKVKRGRFTYSVAK